MKTIIQGNRDKLKEYKYFKCNYCDWVGKAEKTEYKSHTQYNETDYFVYCPCCERAANEITDKRKLENIIKEEFKMDKGNYWENR